MVEADISTKIWRTKGEGGLSGKSGIDDAREHESGALCTSVADFFTPEKKWSRVDVHNAQPTSYNYKVIYT